ncbi:alpha/beta fold hydrolase [Kineosporia sp. R_H_3]|uniref:alpha/beta fold hydrolase n=1 Tax=Kineosporia sp. R_H_3 TaxID=1961848 RepID=UPI000B4BA542|nr:alpha/beta hydrolase [Kineosporia sp. R_H_3]
MSRRPRARRALRRAGVVAATLVVALTVASWGFNRLTDEPSAAPPGLTYVRTGDLMTRVSVHGSTGPAVVLVPGAAESAGTWDAVAQRLSAGHRVYAYDVVGWGYTQRQGPYDLDHAARQLLGLLDALGLDRPVLVGHSSGAAVVVEAALRAPQRVGGLMLLDGDALATGAGARSPVRYVVLPPYRTTLLRLAVGSDAVVRGVYDGQCGPRCPRLDAAGIDGWRRPFRVEGAEDALWAMLDTGVLGVPTARLSLVAGLDVPKAVVFGAQDDVFPAGTPQETARRIGAPPPRIIPDARHLTPVSDPAAVAEAVAALADGAPDDGP